MAIVIAIILLERAAFAVLILRAKTRGEGVLQMTRGDTLDSK
jgi:hypothetical protein